ncbi:MAG: DHH family phosphoesterase [Opitutales bacterium]|nr:DHH family phosphoesterase [Opitutales bacterium]
MNGSAENGRARAHFVVGHRNPDTDAIVSAHVLAWMHRQQAPASRALPVRLGEANRQTAWLFETAGIPLPALRGSCLAQAAEIARSAPVVDPDTPLREALEAIQRTGAPCAVVCDENGAPLGIVSDRHPRTNYLLQCNVEDFFGTLLEFGHIIRGLPLEALNGGPPPAPQHLEVVIHKHTFAGRWDPASALVLGDRDLLLEVLHRNPPAAVILAGVERARAREMAAQLPCPAFLFSGSVINLCARLPGCLPCSAALENDFVTVAAETDLAVLERKVRAQPLGILVTNASGRLVGAISADTLLHAPQPLLSLVDHSERRQSIGGLERAEILEIVDHHRLGDIETDAPIAIDVRPVGSTATILRARAAAAGLALPPEIAQILLGALISDTLLLTSPTTTTRDTAAAAELAALADLDLRTFGLAVLRQNDELKTTSPDNLVARDCKEFAHGDITFLLAQIETTDLSVLDRNQAVDLRRSLLARVRTHHATFGILLVTDVLAGRSELIPAADDTCWEDVLRPERGNGHGRDETPWVIEGMVSRKKQLLPLLLGALRARESA